MQISVAKPHTCETTESGAWWEGVSQRRADAPRFCGVLHAATVGPPGGRRREEKQHTPSQGESLVGDRHGILCGGAYCPWSEPVPILRPCRGHVGPGRAQTVGESRRPRPRAASRACHRAVGCQRPLPCTLDSDLTRCDPPCLITRVRRPRTRRLSIRQCSRPLRSRPNRRGNSAAQTSWRRGQGTAGACRPHPRRSASGRAQRGA